MDGEERLRWRKNIGRERERKIVEKIVEEGGNKREEGDGRQEGRES